MKTDKNLLLKLIIIINVFYQITGCTGFNTLPPPENVTATDIKCHNNRITVSWDSVKGADYYQLYRSQASYSSNNKHRLSVASVSSVNPTTPYLNPPKDKQDSECGYKITVEKNLLSTNYEDFSVEQGVSYYYKIKALNKLFVESALSNTAEGAAGTFPDFPDNFAATDGIYTDKILLVWNKVEEAKLYRIYKSDTINGEYKQTGNDIFADSTYTTPPGPVNLHAEFFSDVDLSQKVFVSGLIKKCIRIKIGDDINVLTEFSGKTLGVSYSREDIINTINDKVREYTGDEDITVCLPVDTDDNKKFVKIVSNRGNILIINEVKTVFYSAIDDFLKEGITNWSGAPALSELINGSIEITPKPIPMPQPPEGDYGFIDTDVQVGKKYFYRIRVVDEKNEESHLSPVNNGYAASAAAPSAPGGINIDANTAGRVVVKWNHVNDADKYRVYRSESAEGLYLQISPDIASSILEFTDTTIEGDNVYYYRITAVNINGLESMFSISGEGQGKLTPIEFCAKMYQNYKYLKAKCDYIEPNPLSSHRYNIPGDIGGTMLWTLDIHGTSGTARWVFTGYNDFGLVWNGEVYGDSGISGDGAAYGTVNLTGTHEAQVKFFIQFRNRQDCGGHFLVSYPAGEPEVRIEFSQANQ